MKAILLALLVISSVFAGHHGHHNCIHDKIQERFSDREISEFTMNEETERTLQSVAPRKMKITYDMSYFKNLKNTPENQIFRQTAEKAIKIAISYFTDLLTIVPKPVGSMKWDKRSDKCGLASVPKSDMTVDKDSDLHLYVTYTNESMQSYLAYAGWCRFLKVLGPTHGQVNFNQDTIGLKNLNDPIIFQDFIQTTIHEILHVLGFSAEVIPDWVDANKRPHVNPTTVSKIRGQSSTSISTPNVQKAAREYYGCSTIPGVPVENQGDSGSAGSHWETTAILDEMMNAASSATNSIMSVFTIALLKDTGFYASVNEKKFVEPSFYGKDEGCGFITGDCDATKKEFCQVGQKNSCDFYHHGSSYCAETFFTDQGCGNWQTYSNAKCFDVNSGMNTPTNTKVQGTSFGTNSKCFMTSLLQNGYVPRKEQSPGCYNFQCTADGRVTINVGSTPIVCSRNGQKLTVPGYTGQITCPEKLDEFCSLKKMCPNHCSSNGYCMNGACLCMDGINTMDCSVPKN